MECNNNMPIEPLSHMRTNISEEVVITGAEEPKVESPKRWIRIATLKRKPSKK